MTNPSPMKLRLCVKDEGDNLFVRLSEGTIKNLVGRDHVAAFFPLSIEFLQTTVYSSWNGGIMEQDDSVQIPRNLLPDFSTLPSMVEVKVLTTIQSCQKVHVEPISSKDWELVQCDSEVLQEGAFLQQVSVIYTKQRLRLKLEDDWVELVVNHIENFGDNEKKVDYGLLRQDTEVIIAPRLRGTKDIVDWTQPQTLIPSQDDWSEALLNLHKRMGIDPLPVAPGCVLINDTTWNSNYSWALLQTTEPQNEQKQKRLVRVISRESVPEGNAVLHRWIRQELGLQCFCGSIRLRPTSTPRELTLEEVALAPIKFRIIEALPTHRKQGKKAPRKKSIRSLCLSNSCNFEEVILPLNCIFQSSSLEQQELQTRNSTMYFRLVNADGEKASQQPDSILVCDQRTRHRLLALCNASTTADQAPELLKQAEFDGMICPLSDHVVSSISWAENVTDLLRKHDQLWVTLWGESGSGKTFSSLLLCAMRTISQHTPSLYLDCKRLQETTSSLGEILGEIDAVFEHAAEVKDCTIVLDDIDLLAPNLLDNIEQDSSARRVEVANPIAISQSKVIADRVLQLIEATTSSRISLVTTCQSADSLHLSLHQCIRAPTFKMEVPTLSHNDRIKVLEQLTQNNSWMQTAPIFKVVGHEIDGFRPRDLEKVASRVRQEFRSKEKEFSNDETLARVLKGYTSLSHLSLNEMDHTVSTTWQKIGGLFAVKSKLESIVFHPVKYRLIYEKASIRLPRGILLFGPPGCGKSTLAPALANACKFPLISCKGPEIFDKYIGASEAKVRELFKRACDVAPSILFLDELDSLAPRRGSDHTGVTDRVVNQLLTFLDGVEDNSGGTVYVVAATSRPDKVDSALLRPGRLEEHLFVGPPETDEELFDLFSKLLLEWNLGNDCDKIFSSIENAKNMLSLARNNECIFPSDIKAALVTAHVSAVRRALETQKPEDIREVKICLDDLTVALQDARPSLSGNDAAELGEIFKKFNGDKAQRNVARGKDSKLKVALR